MGGHNKFKNKQTDFFLGTSVQEALITYLSHESLPSWLIWAGSRNQAQKMHPLIWTRTLFTFLRSKNCEESKIVEWEVAEIDLSELWNSSQDSCEWLHPQKAIQFIHSMQPIILSSSFQHLGRENTTQHDGVSLFCDGAMEVEKLSTPGCTLC